MNLLNRSCNWIRVHFPKEKVNKFSIVVIMFYYYVGLLSYITVPLRPVYRLFTSGSSVAVIVRALMTAIMIVYCLLVVIVNKEKIKWKWAVVFIYVLLFTLLSTALSPQTYTYIFKSHMNYGTIYWVKASTGFNRLFTMFLSSISDFILGFCFLFILPLVVNSKKQMLILLMPIMLIGILECCYSVLFERAEYTKIFNMINPEYGGYNANIGATFGNKEDWGSFLTVSFCSSIVSFFCIGRGNVKKLLLRISCIICSLVFFFFTVFSLCKTAIGAEIFVFFILSLYLFFVLIRKNKIVFIVYLVIFASIIFLIIAFYTIPSFHNSGVLNKIYNFTYEYIIKRIFGGVSNDRTSIWLRYVENLRTYNLFFGLSKGGVNTFSKVITVEGQYLIHNGFAYFFASYGILGFSVYILCLAHSLIYLFRLRKISLSLFFALLGVFACAMVFSLAEVEVLLISSSNPIFIFNILVCVLPKGIYLKYKNNITYKINEVNYEKAY